MGDFAQLNDNEAELLSGGGNKGTKTKDSSANRYDKKKK